MTPKEFALTHQEETLELLKTLGRIPAPSLREEKRAAFCQDWLIGQGAEGVYIDEALNVIWPVGDCSGNRLTVFAAHTDVVFDDTDPLPLRQEGERLYAPGIGDDTANLVCLLMGAKYLLTEGITPEQGFLVVCNSGEEGLGNLRGTRELFRCYDRRIRRFYSFDCHSDGCVNQAVGSYRYRVTCRTEGGHSYFDFGRENAIAVLCRLVTMLYAVELPEGERITYNVGTVTGGTSVNTIAQEASLLYEFRSTAQSGLAYMEKQFRAMLKRCAAEGVTLEVELLGVRPGNGSVNPEEERVLTDETCRLVSSVTGTSPTVGSGSTDSNVPLSMGIPAITLGTIRGGGMHTREEWVDPSSLPQGVELVCRLMETQTI